MTIQAISFGKLFNSKKTETNKTQSSPIEEKGLTKEEQTSLNKIRTSVNAKYLAALMGSATLAPTVTSCMQQETNVVVDTSELTKMIADLVALNKTLVEQMDQNNKDNAAMIAQNKKIIEILNNVLKNTDDLKAGMETAILLITQLIEQTNKNDKEFLKKLDAILNSNLETNDKLDKILEENKQQNIKLALIQELLKEMKEQDRALAEKIEKYYNEYKENSANSDKAYTEMFEKIYNEIIKSNTISEEQRDEIKDLKEQLKQQAITEAEYWAKVIALLGSIDGSLNQIKTLIDELKLQNKELSEKIEKWYNEYKENAAENDNAYKEMFEKIYNEIVTSNTINSETRDEIKDLKEQLKQQAITEAEYWAKVIELLGSIDSSLSEIKADIKKLAADLPGYFESITNRQDESKEILQDIKNNTTDIKNSINEIKENQKIANENLIKIANNTDQINANLEIIKVQQGNMLTKEDLKELFGPAYEGIMKMLGNISGNQISIEQLQEALAKNKTDLTKTNALIETLTTVVQNMNNGATEMAEVIKILNEMKNASGEDRAAIIAAFEKALEKLGKIEGSLDALLATANEIKADFKAAIKGAEKYANKFYEELKNVTSGISTNTAALERYAEQARESFLESQKEQEKQTAILQAIFEKETDGNGNIDIDALIAKLPNYTEILTQIKDAIGHLPTKEDALTIINGAKTDLTKTNALIETLTTVVQNMSSVGGGGNVDMSETNRIIGEILDAIAQGKLDDSKNFEKYYELAQKAMEELLKISNNTKPNVTTRSTNSNDAVRALMKLAIPSNQQAKGAPKGWVVFNDTREMGQKLRQIDMYKQINPSLAREMEKELGLV